MPLMASKRSLIRATERKVSRGRAVLRSCLSVEYVCLLVCLCMSVCEQCMSLGMYVCLLVCLLVCMSVCEVCLSVCLSWYEHCG